MERKEGKLEEIRESARRVIKGMALREGLVEDQIDSYVAEFLALPVPLDRKSLRALREKYNLKDNQAIPEKPMSPSPDLRKIESYK